MLVALQMYCPESWRPTLVSVNTPSATVCFHGNGARSLDQVITGGGLPVKKRKCDKRSAAETFGTQKRGKPHTSGLAHHCDRVSFHHRHLLGVHRRQRGSQPTLNEDLHFDLRHPLAVFALADINPRVIRMDRRPLRKEAACVTPSLAT